MRQQQAALSIVGRVGPAAPAATTGHWRMRVRPGRPQDLLRDHGQSAPMVLVHGYLLDGRSWEKQETAMLTARYRVTDLVRAYCFIE